MIVVHGGWSWFHICVILVGRSRLLGTSTGPIVGRGLLGVRDKVICVLFDTCNRDAVISGTG